MLTSHRNPPPFGSTRPEEVLLDHEAAFHRVRGLIRTHRVVLVLGLPGSGRSTLLDRLRRRLGRGVRPAVVWNAQDPIPADDLAAAILDLERRRALLVLDDLERWQPTRVTETINALARGLERGRALIALERNPALAPNLERHCARIFIGGLREDAANALVDAHTSSPLAEAVCERLFAATGRHPSALLDALTRIQRGIEPEHAIRRACQERLAASFESLPANALTILDALALAGAPIERSILARASALEPLEPPLRELLCRLLVVQANERFTLPALVHTAFAAWRKLPELGRTDRARYPAPHPTPAAGPCPWRSVAARLLSCLNERSLLLTRALELALATDDASNALCAFAQAAPTWIKSGESDLVLERLDAIEPLIPSDHAARLSTWRSEALLVANRIDEAAAEIERARAEFETLAPGSESSDLEHLLRLFEARVCAFRQQRSRARALLEGLADRFEREQKTTERAVQALCLESFLDGSEWRLDEAERKARRALALATRIDDPIPLAEAAHTLGNALFRMRRHDEALRQFQHAMALHQETGRLDRALITLQQLVVLLTDRGQVEHARSLCERLATQAGTGLEPPQSALLERCMGFAYLHSARYEEAAHCFERARETWQQIGVPLRVAASCIALAEAELGRRRPEALRLALDAAAKIQRRHGDERGALEIELERATALAELGRFEEARTGALACARAFTQLDATLSQAQALSLAAVCAFRLGDRSDAERKFNLARNRLESLPSPKPENARTIELELAALSLHMGRVERALEYAETCRAAFEPNDNSLTLLLAKRLVMECHQRLGSLPAARTTERHFDTRLAQAAPLTQDALARRLDLLDLGLPKTLVIRTPSAPARAVSSYERLCLCREPERYALVIDGPGARIHKRNQGWIELERSPLLLRLALELALQDNRALDTVDLFERVWGHPRYEPHAQRRVVHTAIRRLRALLTVSEEGKEALQPIRRRGKKGGYQLDPNADVVVVATALERSRALLPTTARSVLTFLEERGPLSTSEIAKQRSSTAAEVRKILRNLLQANLITRTGSGRATRYRVVGDA